MFRNRRSSQKPDPKLISKFQKTFGDIFPPIASRDGAPMEQANDNRAGPDFTSMKDLSSMNMGLNDLTPKAMHDLRLTPFFDANTLSYLPPTSQPNAYCTPNSAEMGVALQTQLDEFHPPPAPLNMISPVSLSQQFGGAPMDNNGAAMDFSAFDQPYFIQQYNGPTAISQNPALAASDFLKSDSGYGTTDDPIEQTTAKDVAMQDHFSWAMDQTELSGAEPANFRYEATLRAPTAMIKHQNEVPVTYLNKGQTYSLSIADSAPPTPLQSARYRTHIRISFDEEEQRSKPAACWQLWKEGRGLNEAHQRGGKLQAVEYVDPTEGGEEHKRREIQLESASFDGFCITWTPNSARPPDCTIPIRFNFLSTDFSHSKGVKGVPVRLCAKTEGIPAGGNPGSNPEVCYCKVKLFRDHGAERKLSNDVAHVKKSIEKLKQQMAQAEVGGVGFGKRKRGSASVTARGADDHPAKIVKPHRRWSVDTQNVGSGRMSLEDDLHAKLEMMQDMFTSTRPVSALSLRGDEQDDPVLHPVQLPGETKVEGTGELPEVTWGSAVSPENSVASTNSSLPAMRSQFLRVESESGYNGSQQSPREQSRPCSEGAVDQFVKLPVRVNRTNKQPGYIEAMDVDSRYQPPPEHLPKPVACLYIRFPQTRYHRAVYLTERTTSDLADKIAQKQRISPDRIVRIVHISQTGLQVQVDDDLVRELPEGQDMAAEFAEVPMAGADGDSPRTGFAGFEVKLSF